MDRNQWAASLLAQAGRRGAAVDIGSQRIERRRTGNQLLAGPGQQEIDEPAGQVRVTGRARDDGGA